MSTAERFEDLIAWQLSEALKEEVFRLTQRERVARDKKYCDQIQESARSAPANIAEGFGRYDPKPNAYHVSIAKGSLEETKNHIIDGFKRNRREIRKTTRHSSATNARLCEGTMNKNRSVKPDGNLKQRAGSWTTLRTRTREPREPEPAEPVEP